MMQPIPCLHTDLDAMEIDDLRTRIEALAARVVASDGPTTKTGPLPHIVDAHGRIYFTGSATNLSIECQAWAGMGSLKLSMPLPVGQGQREAKASRLRRDDLIRLLYIWLGYLDAREEPRDRLALCVSAILRTANPDAGPQARITVLPEVPYQAESTMTSAARIPSITAGGKPILAKEIERSILSLHPSATISRLSGKRDFAMAPRSEYAIGVLDLGMPEILRAISELGVRDIRKPVLKAGLDLR